MLALVEKDAAIMIKDIEAKEKLIDKAIELANNSELMIKLSKNIAELAMPNSDELIANEVFKLIK
jgi:UDP-N-acetylglucosamine--N-acetylmuramyl-(pentapeptide) pyrophosphoryl-undecaprenol N-acetylglucosamine transferase